MDINYIFIRFLEKIGLARNVIMPKHIRAAKRKQEIQPTKLDRMPIDSSHTVEALARRSNTVKNHIENNISRGDLSMHQTPTETQV